MAARRLLIVMLILLGISTLAAALVPQHALRNDTTTGPTATQTTQTATTPPPAGRALSAKIVVGKKKVPVVAGPVCGKRKPRCEPIHVGDQLSLKVLSRPQAELEIPAFGLIGVAAPNSPALFQLLLDEPTRVGILFTSSHSVAARIEVLSAAAAAKAVEPPAKGKAKSKAKSRARGESGPP
jgi:hypothetical protein